MKEVQLNYRLTEIRDTRNNFTGIEGVDIPYTLLSNIFINNYLGMIERNMTRYNSHIQSLFKVSTIVKNEQGLVLCAGSGCTVYVKKDSGHRHWLGVVTFGITKLFRLGGRGSYFTPDLINEIRTSYRCFSEDVISELKKLLERREFTSGFEQLKRPNWFKRFFNERGVVDFPDAELNKHFCVNVFFKHPFNGPSEYTINLYKRGGVMESSTLEERHASEKRNVNQQISGEMSLDEFKEIINDYQARLICESF